ncbi:unnamed protein product [Rotaria sp. Silwood1]|nr:unnamed protein product [Rotaria sp. Silwood1]
MVRLPKSDFFALANPSSSSPLKDRSRWNLTESLSSILVKNTDLDALRLVNDLESLYEILSCTKKLADDIVTQVQIDTLEKFVSIIEYLIGNVENGDVLIKEYLFQSIIQTIGHSNNRIRKASQSALIRLFEMDQIKSDEIERDIIPSLCQLDRA